IQDGGASNPNLHTGSANYKEFWYTMVGLAGEGENFDGNGMYVRFQPGGGPFTVSTGPSTFSGQQLFGNAVSPPLGTRPKYGRARPTTRTSPATRTSSPTSMARPPRSGRRRPCARATRPRCR